MADGDADLSVLIRSLNDGDPAALDELITRTYTDLRHLAHQVFAGSQNTLQATAVLHEALLRLRRHSAGGEAEEGMAFESPAHFFARASLEIRAALIDHIRARKTQKRGGGRQRVQFDPGRHDHAASEPAYDFEALHVAIDKLRTLDEEQGRLLELKFFCGYTNEQVAEALGCSLRTAQNRWSFCRAWLRRELGSGTAD